MAPQGPPGFNKRPVSDPQCTHLTMTRIYSPQLPCATCHCPGPLGWLYLCTQDRDDLIEQAVARGELANMDELSCVLTSNMGLRQRSPAAREDTLSFFNEITQQQMSHYRPDQVANILKQRENVQLVIQREKIRKNSAAILNRLTQPGGAESASCHYDFQKPWVCSPHEECQYRVCLLCRPGSSDRAFLSLNAVARGEISPTAATGYGFHVLGERPVVDAEIVKHIGCRPVPLSASTSEHDSPASTLSVMDLLDTQIARGRLLWARKKEDAEMEESDDDSTWPSTPDSTPGQLKHSPGCENLGLFAHATPATCPGSLAPLLWTPPPSPITISLHEKDGTAEPRARVNQDSQNQRHGHFREPSLDETTTNEPQPSNEDAKFTPSPLKVGRGVARLGESVELGVPDVLTQA